MSEERNKVNIDSKGDGNIIIGIVKGSVNIIKNITYQTSLFWRLATASPNLTSALLSMIISVVSSTIGVFSTPTPNTSLIINLPLASLIVGAVPKFGELGVLMFVIHFIVTVSKPAGFSNSLLVLGTLTGIFSGVRIRNFLLGKR